MVFVVVVVAAVVVSAVGGLMVSRGSMLGMVDRGSSPLP